MAGRNNWYSGDRRNLFRQLIAAWVVLFLGVLLFTLISLSLSGLIKNVELVILISFTITALLTVVCHIHLKRINYYLLSPFSAVSQESVKKNLAEENQVDEGNDRVVGKQAVEKRGLLNQEDILVLLIEDNADHAELVIRTMESHHIPTRIMHLTDGESALDYLLRRNNFQDPETSPRPHMILLDLRLPRVDGLKVLRVIKEEVDLRSIPIVVLTTSEAEQAVTQAYDHYVNSYLVKPVDFEDFRKLLNDLGLYWRTSKTYSLPSDKSLR